MNRILFFLLLFIGITTFAQSPKFDWVTQEGNASEDFGNSIQKASNGDVYVTIGFKGSTNLGGIIYNQSGPMNYDFLICKYNNSGVLQWAKHLYATSGSNILPYPRLKIDGSDNLYFMASYEGMLYFDGSSYSPNTGFQPIGVFAAKISNSGSVLWAKNLMTTYSILTRPVYDVTPSGTIMLTGNMVDSIKVGSNKYASVIDGNIKSFFSSINSAGTVSWVTIENGTKIVDELKWTPNGVNFQIAGVFSNSLSFPSASSTTSITSVGNADVFIAQYHGTAFASCNWAKSIGSSATDNFYGLEVDVNSNTTIIARINANAVIYGFPVTVSSTSKLINAQFTSAGSCNFAIPISEGDVEIRGTSKDNAGNIYLSGTFSNKTYFGSDSLTSNGSADALLIKIAASGNYVWAKGWGAIGYDVVAGVSSSNNNEIYCAGSFSGVTTFGSFTKTASGNYDPFIAKLSGCDIPTVNITYNGNTTLCNGESLTLNANSIPSAAFQWLKNNVPLPNETGNTLIASSAGTYSLDVNLGGVCRDTFGSVTVTVNNINASIQSAQPSICPDGTMQLYTNIPFSSYSWSTGVSTPTVTINQQGNYAVTVTDGAGCKDTAYVTIGEYTPPALPTILEGANCQLASSVIQNGYSYKWRLNGNVVGGNSAYLNATIHGSGFYTLEITDANGCKSNTASPLSITCTVGINEVLQTSFNVFPNPNNGTFNVSAHLAEGKLATSKIYSLTGQVVFEKTLQPIGNEINEEINLQNIPLGIYHLQLSVDEMKVFKKLIIE